MPELVGAGLSVIRRPKISVDIITRTVETGDTTVLENPDLFWNLSNAAYNSVFKNTTSEDTSGQCVFISPDGTRMFTVGNTNNVVYQYNLSTPHVVSSAAYSGNSISAVDLSPTGVYFRPDGKKMYVCGFSDGKIYQFNLTSAWDLSTATYEAITLSIASEDIVIQGLFFRDNGLTMYIVGSNTDSIHEYDLGVAWEINSGVYSGNSFNVVSQDNAPSGLYFKPDGTKMFIAGSQNDKIFEYDISVPWDFSTSPLYNGISFDVSPNGVAPASIHFKLDGSRFYVMDNLITANKVFQYDIQ